MSSKRSDILGHDQLADKGRLDMLRANLPVPLIIGAFMLIGLAVESRAFGGYNQRIVMLIGFNIILAVSLQLINGFSGQFSLGHAGFMAVGAYLAAYPALNHSNDITDPGAASWFYFTLAVLVGAVGFAFLLVFWGLRASRAIHSSLPLLLLALLGLWLVIDVSKAAAMPEPPGYFVWTHLFANAAKLFDWLLIAGTPMASGVTAWLPLAIRNPLCIIVLVIGGGCCAGVVGLIVGMPALRLRGDYLAIATLGLAEIIRILIQNSQPLGGALGLTGIPKETNFAWLYGFAVITILVIWRIAYSAKGRAIMAVRDDEIAASAVGVDTTHHKVMAFVIGSFFGGVAGALFALHERNISPYQFGLQKSIEIVVMVTLGGLGSISGAIVAAAVLTVLLELLRDPPSLGVAGWVVAALALVVLLVLWRRRNDRRMLWTAIAVFACCFVWELAVTIARRTNVQLADYRMILYSLSLVLMMLLRPQGLLGGVELWRRRKIAIAGAPT